jgi:type IV pilus assembly protein PilW
MTKKTIRYCNDRGFTLVELMITLAVSTLIAAALYSTYILQQRTYVNQGAVVEMQQNARVAIDFLSLDLRMAGYDPMNNNIGGITAADSVSISFTADMDKSGGLGTTASLASENEYFSYALANNVVDGVTIPTLCRSASTSPGINCQPMADYIERLEFRYMYENGTAATTTPAAGTFNDIRAVQVTMLARAAKPDSKFTNTTAYTTASGTVWPAANDGFRRRMLITQIDLRNMGL